MIGAVETENTKDRAVNRRSVIVGSAAAAAGAGAGFIAGKIAEADPDIPTATGSFKIVDNRGKQRFLFESRKPPIILGGKTYPPEARHGSVGSCMVFNDENGDEKGGISVSSDNATFALDYPNGDALHLEAAWEGKRGAASLSMNHFGDPTAPIEQAKHPLGVRLYAYSEEGAGLTLCDPQGRPRIQLRVAMDGTPSIVFLDEKGAVTKQF